MENYEAIRKQFLKAQDRLVFQSSDLSLGTIANMVEQGSIDLAPDYQRRERWDVKKQSSLIESFLLNVPVPPVYLAEDEFGEYSVVDGKQRITSIHRFMTNLFSLRELESFPEVEDAKFENLPRELQNALLVRPYVRVITLLRQSDPTLKYEVFTRLNRGGETMRPQEVRNVAFRGVLNDLIYKLAQHPFLRKQLKIANENSSAFKLMDDAEYVLRFFALRDSWRKFSGDYRGAMDNFMLHNMSINKDGLEDLQSVFEKSIDVCEGIWGENAFKRPAVDGWRDQVLAGVYDAQMIAVDLLSRHEQEKAMSNSKNVVQNTYKLFSDDEFDSAVRVGTNNPRKLRYRIDKVKEILT